MNVCNVRTFLAVFLYRVGVPVNWDNNRRADFIQAYILFHNHGCFQKKTKQTFPDRIPKNSHIMMVSLYSCLLEGVISSKRRLITFLFR